MSPEGELQLQAIWTTPFVNEWLHNTSKARIHSVYRHSCNLVNEDGSLISLVLPLVGPGPFAIVLDGGLGNFEQEFTVNMPAVSELTRIELGDWTIALGEAAQWIPNPGWDVIRNNRARLQEQLAGVSSILAAGAPTGSFAPLALQYTEISDGVQQLALKAAREPAAMLLQALAESDESTVREAAMRLAGLGGGVTPSGDDFLVGVMFALWALTDDDRAILLSKWITESARDRTNVISNAWLAAARRGEAGIEWHQFFEAIVIPDQKGLDQVTTALIKRGHTSGADAMAGFIAAAKHFLD
jgi:hypothetical protein